MTKKRNNLIDLTISASDNLNFSLIILKNMSTQTNEYFGESLTAEKLRSLIFVNKCWRLTNAGHGFLSSFFKSYKSRSNSNLITGKILLGMDRGLTNPWYIRGQQVVLFDQSSYFELEMFNGNLVNFIDFKNVNC